MRSTHRILVLVAGAAVAAAIPGPPAAAARDDADPAVARYLESLEIAPAIEHRLVILHPVLARTAPVKDDERFRLAGVASPDLLAVGRVSPSAKTRVQVVSFAEEPALALEGDVLRTPTSDQVVTEDAVLHRGNAAELRIARVSREVDEDPSAAESSFMGEVLPSPLRYLVMTNATGAALRTAADAWADDVKLQTPRRSPEELGAAETVVSRFRDYRKALAELPRPAAGSGREVVGIVALVDGAFASMETFADGEVFRQAWPRMLAAISAEATVQESRQGLLAEALSDPADPDRFVAPVKERLLALFAARAVARDVAGGARRIDLTVDAASANVIVLGASRFAHFVLVTDPARRKEKIDHESPDPASAARKAHPTEEEKRLIDRRAGGGQPEPAPPKPPEPPTPPAPR
jgi:hypothetical protein